MKPKKLIEQLQNKELWIDGECVFPILFDGHYHTYPTAILKDDTINWDNIANESWGVTDFHALATGRQNEIFRLDTETGILIKLFTISGK